MLIKCSITEIARGSHPSPLAARRCTVERTINNVSRLIQPTYRGIHGERMQAVSIPRVLLLLFMAAPDSVLVGPARELVSSRASTFAGSPTARTPRRGTGFASIVHADGDRNLSRGVTTILPLVCRGHSRWTFKFRLSWDFGKFG